MRLRCIYLMASFVFVCTVLHTNICRADILVYGFEGSLQGWTNIQTSPSGPLGFRTDGSQFGGPDTHAASNGQVIPDIPTFQQQPDGSYLQDAPHRSLILRSPVFQLDGTGNITAWLSGGVETASLPTFDTDLFNVDSIDDGGFLGLALRDDDTGQYLRLRNRSSNSATYQQVEIRQLDIQLNFTGRNLTLDLIDSSHGSWGWTALDSVTINGAITAVPEPSSLALVALSCFGVALRRRRS